MVFVLITFTILVACDAITTTPSQAASTYYPNSYLYTPFDHPLFTLPSFSYLRNRTVPVLMRRYYLWHKQFGPRSALYSSFHPGVANYIHADTGLPFVTGADAFFPGLHYPRHTSSSDSSLFGELHLNRDSRCFAVLYTHAYFHSPNASPDSFHPTVSGLPKSWTVIGKVHTPDQRHHDLGDPGRHGSRDGPGMMPRGLAMEAPVVWDDDLKLLVVRFPHPWSVSIESSTVKGLLFLFVPHEQANPLFDLRGDPNGPMPILPDPFQSFGADGEETVTVNPSEDPPTPNFDCPQWLHDLHVTTRYRYEINHGHNNDGEPEPVYWRTWHPMVDPIFWCYYDHDHGSFPGRADVYMPPFAYTAWNRPDPTADTGREAESHKGFKVYTIPLEEEVTDDGKIPERTLVLTLHIHTSRARRFTERFHTVSLIVVSASSNADGNAEVELFLSFKSDFGPALAYYTCGNPVPMGSTQSRIHLEVLQEQKKAERVFNVLNIGNEFPHDINKKFRIKGDVCAGPEAVMNGLYEIWRTTLPSCTAPKSRYFGALQFEVRDPPTAARFETGTTDDDIQILHGLAFSRVINILSHPINIGIEHCLDDIRQQVQNRDGSFYSDAYFANVSGSGGAFRLSQFVKPDFQSVLLQPGVLQINDPWAGPYIQDGSPGLQHIEQAVKKMSN